MSRVAATFIAATLGLAAGPSPEPVHVVHWADDCHRSIAAAVYLRHTPQVLEVVERWRKWCPETR